MNILINLVTRIALGERREKGSQRNTAYWLSAFAIMPIWIVGWAQLMQNLDVYLEGYITDHAWCIILFAIISCLTLFGLITFMGRFFVSHPVVLLLIGVTSWLATAWYVTTWLA